MTDQEKKINDIAEAVVNKFKDLLPYTSNFDIQATKCTIECQREKVELLKSLLTYNGFFQNQRKIFYDLLDEAQQVLDNLTMRLK